jgi:beta-barrel assembly-enhancing protease
MTEKTLFQGLITVAAIAALWFGLSQIDFMRLFNVDEKTNDMEQKLGDMFWESIRRTEDVVKNDTVTKPIDKIVTRICKENGINRDKLKVYVIEKDEMNAFAMPGNYLIIYSGLISECDNESQLAGVIGHEIAHLEKRHVMKKMVKEFGLSVLMSMAGGNAGRMTSEAVHALSSSAYDRRLESEADYTAVDYMIGADIDPTPFADLMYKMGTDGDLPDAVYWVSTHPESEARAEAIVDYIKGKKYSKKPILTDAEWQSLKKKTQFELL